MRFTEDTHEKIEKVYYGKLKANPIHGHVIGLGLELGYSAHSQGDCVYQNGCVVVCSLESLSRMIEELTMLKESVEEVTGVML